MNQADYKWLHENIQLLGNVKCSREQLQRLYDIYNYVSNQNIPISSCGRCVANVKKRLLAEYERIQGIS